MPPAQKQFSKKKTFENYISIYEEYRKKYGKIALLYQLGKFYEIYGLTHKNLGNVQEVSEVLEIKLTKANKKLEQATEDNPEMAGFNDTCIKEKVGTLVKYGFTVVIFKQFEISEGEFERRLDEVISPGTYTENLKDDEVSYLGCFYVQSAGSTSVGSTSTETIVSISCIDISTGKCLCKIITGKNIENKIERELGTIPKEVILIGDSYDFNLKTYFRKVELKKEYRKLSYQEEFLKKIFPSMISPIENLNLEKYPTLIISFIVLLEHIFLQNEKLILSLHKPKIEENNSNLFLSQRTLQQLNVVSGEKSLYDVMNMCSTNGGKRLLKKRLCNPIVSYKKLKRRYDEIESIDYMDIETILKGVPDLERLHQKLFLLKLNPSDLYKLLESYNKILVLFEKNILVQHLNEITIQKFKELTTFLNKNITSECAKYNIDNIETNIFFEKGEIYKLETELKKKYSKLDQICENIADATLQKDGKRYCLRLTTKRYKNLKNKKEFTTKKCKSYVKLFNDELDDISGDIEKLKEKIQEKAKTLYIKFLEDIKIYKATLHNIAEYVSYVDIVKTAKKVAVKYNYCKPLIKKGKSFFDIKEMRHPILERVSEELFIPNDFYLNGDGSLLYGFNGVGKSMLLKSVGISILLAQCGFYVPAASFSFSPYETLITKVGTTDNFYKGHSTFVSEMLDLRDMLEKNGSRSLLLADELCSGTETNSAISLVSAAIIQLCEKGSAFLFTTHFHQLCEVKELQKLQNLRFYSLSVELFNNEIKYGRKLVEGSGDSSYGIDIAKILNVGNNEYIEKASEIRRKLEKKETRVVESKTSRYNKDVYMTKCERCDVAVNLHTHHKIPQSETPTGKIRGQSKNIKGNLEVLCDSCHKKHHSKKN